MMRLVKTSILGLAFFVPAAIVEAQIRTYTANFVETAPTIDGAIGVGEWTAAASGGDSWTLLRTPNGGSPDGENNRFSAVWNFDGIYFLGESDYSSWATDLGGQNPATADFSGDFFNVFLDPNTLGEANGQLDTEIDNYQIGFNVYPDARSCGGDGIAGTADDCTQEPAGDPLPPEGVSVTGSTFGSLTAAHVDGLFNNDSEWEHLRLTHVSYDAGEGGAVIEMFIPWEEFDARATTRNPPAPTEVDTGLNHPFAPSNGDVWFLNVTRQSSDMANFLPVWNWTSNDFFASHGNGTKGEGHGLLTFVGAPLAGDYNDDGTVNAADYVEWRDNLGQNVTLPGDTTPGTVTQDDYDVWLNNFGAVAAAASAAGSSAAGVPEPSTIILLVLASVAALQCGRRERGGRVS